MLIDAHAHLDLYEDEDLEIALQQIERHRIFTVSNALDPSSYQRALAIGASRPRILPVFGVHPWRATDFASRLDTLEEETASSPMLGEIGLDFHFVTDRSEYPAQRKVFAFFLDKAALQDKVVNLHTKGAEAEVHAMLRERSVRRAIIHWYSGPLEWFQRLAETGAFFTIGAEVLSSDFIRRLAREIPEDRLLTETDNPGGPRSLTGQTGMPSLLLDVIREVARVRDVTPEDLERTVAGNFARLVGDDPHLAPAYSAAGL